MSATIATYDLPDDGPVRPVHELRAAVAEAARRRLGAQHTRIARDLPDWQRETNSDIFEAIENSLK
ncbi:hypothetical protein [Streptomyces sp. NPDC000851]